MPFVFKAFLTFRGQALGIACSKVVWSIASAYIKAISLSKLSRYLSATVDGYVDAISSSDCRRLESVNC